MVVDRQLRAIHVVEQRVEYVHRQGLLNFGDEIYRFEQVVDSTASLAVEVKMMTVVVESRWRQDLEQNADHYFVRVPRRQRTSSQSATVHWGVLDSEELVMRMRQLGT